MELTAAFLSACSELVRFDLKLALVLGGGRLTRFGIGTISSFESSLVSANGWSEAQSSDAGSDLDSLSFLKVVIDFRLRNDSGVERLSFEPIERSSASSEGIDSADSDRMFIMRSSGRLSADTEHASSLLSDSSSRTLRAGLLPSEETNDLSVFHSLTNSSNDIRRGLAARRNCPRFGGGISVYASSAATAGGSAFTSWFEGIVLLMVLLFLATGMLRSSAVRARSTLGTDTGFVGARTGSVIVRAEAMGLGADVILLLGTELLRNPFFSSRDSIGGAAA